VWRNIKYLPAGVGFNIQQNHSKMNTSPATYVLRIEPNTCIRYEVFSI
jgi:hypothetical protein